MVASRFRFADSRVLHRGSQDILERNCMQWRLIERQHGWGEVHWRRSAWAALRRYDFIALVNVLHEGASS